MKTAIALMIERVESDTVANYSHSEVLEMLLDYEGIQNSQIQTAYLHGKINTREKSVGSEDYFNNEFKN